MNASFFDVLHNAADHNILAIREGVHVDFNRVFQKFVDEHGTVL